jgi:hypothetical protein
MRRGSPPGYVTRSQTFLDLRRLVMQSGNVRMRRAMRLRGKRKAIQKDGRLGAVSGGLAGTWLVEPSLAEPSIIAGSQDPLYLFACHLEWHHRRNLSAYQALVAALDDSDQRIRVIAEMLLHRSSPRPQRKDCGLYSR